MAEKPKNTNLKPLEGLLEDANPGDVILFECERILDGKKLQSPFVGIYSEPFEQKDTSRGKVSGEWPKINGINLCMFEEPRFLDYLNLPSDFGISYFPNTQEFCKTPQIRILGYEILRRKNQI